MIVIQDQGMGVGVGWVSEIAMIVGCRYSYYSIPNQNAATVIVVVAVWHRAGHTVVNGNIIRIHQDVAVLSR